MTRILNVCRSAVVWLIDDGVFVLTLPSQGGAMGQFSYVIFNYDGAKDQIFAHKGWR